LTLVIIEIQLLLSIFKASKITRRKTDYEKYQDPFTHDHLPAINFRLQKRQTAQAR
jgi:hypothetical protein